MLYAEFIPIPESEASTLGILRQNAIGFYEKMGGVIVDRNEGNEKHWQNSIFFKFSILRDTGSE